MTIIKTAIIKSAKTIETTIVMKIILTNMIGKMKMKIATRITKNKNRTKQQCHQYQ